MKQSTILYGVCGIGNGHTFRQLPIIEHLAIANTVMIFAYGASLKTYTPYFGQYPNIHIAEVAVPFFKGGDQGLDFAATAALAMEHTYVATNAQAMAAATNHIGKPDLVISDFEPICAQYAYAHNAPLITIDQQSKYLVGDFPGKFNGQTYTDEQMRLRMFFPKAAARIACSFFGVTPKTAPTENVHIYPSIIRDDIINMQRNPAQDDHKSILVYITANQPTAQSLDEIAITCAALVPHQFHLFLPKSAPLPANTNSLSFYHHGDDAFNQVLATCNGIISTAGHGLLSEAMHLSIPVYTLPLPLYEQEMNAHVIAQNGFGIKSETIDTDTLHTFIEQLPVMTQNILADDHVLLHGSAQQDIIEFLEQSFLRSLGRVIK